MPSRFQQDGNEILLVGSTRGEFGGSLYIKELFGETVGSIADIDYSSELALWKLVIDANSKGLLVSAKDVNVGGIAIALSKMSALSSRGIEASIDVANSRDIFDESQSRALVEVAPSDVDSVISIARELGLSISKIGQVGGDVIKINNIQMPLDRVKDIYFGRFTEVIEQDL